MDIRRDFIYDNNNKIISLAIDGNYAIISIEGSATREPSVYVFERRQYLITDKITLHLNGEIKTQIII